jgi:HPt (histidine-containing phosphotransfer) domain-containing protein
MTVPGSDPQPLVSVVFPGAPVIDAEIIDGLRMLEDDDEPNVVTELVGLFMENAPPRLTAMHAALDSGDRVALSRVAHSLKSSSANLGAHGMSHLCERLERMKTPAPDDNPAELVTLLEQEYAIVTQALAEIARAKS